MVDFLASLIATGAFWTALAGATTVSVLAWTARTRAKGHELHLWPMGLVLVAAFTAALTTAASVFYTGWDLLDVHGVKHENTLTSKTLFDLVKLSFGFVAGAGALVALVVAYRRQRVTEVDALREATRLHTERFSNAVAQLGADAAAVRLGGIHALTGLADDAPTRELRQTCIDVLCAYLRLPYTAEADLSEENVEARHTYLALREVRHTIIRLIRDHLRLPHSHLLSWRGHNFDFTGTVFDGGDFSKAHFHGGTVDFSGARFDPGFTNFSGAHFEAGEVSFSVASFAGGNVYFDEAHFTGGLTNFSGAEFSSGSVDFSGAHFSGGVVDFTLAGFEGSDVHFTQGHFTDGEVKFNAARFHGSEVSFRNSQFFGGAIWFRSAHFESHKVDFSGAQFNSGWVDFSDARFHGGIADFTGALGSTPTALLPESPPLPDGLLISEQWQTSAASDEQATSS